MGQNQIQTDFRKDLNRRLRSFMSDNGRAENVYFQPPESLKLRYPCIIYRRNAIDDNDANDAVYKRDNGYEVLLIYSDPDDTLPFDFLDEFKFSSYVRSYAADDLNHTVIQLYYH